MFDTESTSLLVTPHSITNNGKPIYDITLPRATVTSPLMGSLEDPTVLLKPILCDSDGRSSSLSLDSITVDWSLLVGDNDDDKLVVAV